MSLGDAILGLLKQLYLYFSVNSIALADLSSFSLSKLKSWCLFDDVEPSPWLELYDIWLTGDDFFCM